MYRLCSVVAAAVLLALAVGDVAADHGYWPAGEVNPAVVAGHERRTDDNSRASDWGTNCLTRAAASDELALDVYGHVLKANYAVAVVLAHKEGVPDNGPYGVTVFRGVKPGQFLWADVDGDGIFAGRHEADAGELFLCSASAVPATDTVTEHASPLPSSLVGGWAAALCLTVLVAVMVFLTGARQRPR